MPDDYCRTCDGEGEMCVGFGLYSHLRPGIAICPVCKGSGEEPPEPPPAERAAAWEREDPAELLRAANEWEDRGHHEYADALRRWASGNRSVSPSTLRPT